MKKRTTSKEFIDKAIHNSEESANASNVKKMENLIQTGKGMRTSDSDIILKFGTREDAIKAYQLQKKELCKKGYEFITLDEYLGEVNNEE